MTGSQIKRNRGADQYEIRPFRDDDRASFLELYETVYSAKSEAWFDWRYEAPYLDHTPIFVAVVDGTVAGAQAFLPFRLRTGDEETLALQPADAMVHPDHRRQGLFTRTSEAAMDFYTDREPTHFFNFPTAAAKPGLQKMGWQVVGRVPTWYRIVNPRPLLADRLPEMSLAVASRTVSAAMDGYSALRRLVAGSPTATVERHDGVPVETLVDIASRARSENIGVSRDESFYRWRFANPRWTSVTTHVASSDGEPTAAIVTATHRTLGMVITKVMDAVAVDEERRQANLAVLLEAAIDDAADSNLIAVSESTVPESVLVGCGFLSDERSFLSSICTPTDMVVRPIDGTDDGWQLGDHSLTDADAWRVTFADQDTPF